MAYSKTNWVNNTTPINETNLNKIEQGIYDNSLVVDAITNTLNPTDTETYKTAELTEGQITDVIGVNDILIKGQTSQNGEPTPSSPVDVNVVSGDNTINIINSNIYNLTKNVTKTDYGFINNTAVPALNSIKLKKGIKYLFSLQLKSKPTTDTTFTIYFKGSPIGKSFGSIENYELNKTYTIEYTSPEDNYLSFHIWGNANNDIFEFRLWINVNEAQEFEFYNTQSFPINLGSLELCKIGDYQDYFYKDSENWYLHKETEKIVINGNENWASISSIGGHYRYGYQYDTHSKPNDNLLCYCNYFKGVARNKIANENDISANLAWINILTSISTLNDFKSMLQTKMPILYRGLATPTNTQIVDTTLISQLEAIYNAPLYEQTNITQTNNDLPMVLDITACKDNINGIKAFIRK